MRQVRRYLLMLVPAVLWGQTASDTTAAGLKAILERLEKLEQQNASLAAEVKSLREDVRAHSSAIQAPATGAAAKETSAAAPAPVEAPLEDRVAVAENRIEEQAQAKVQAANRMPLAVTGMVLFNAYGTSKTDAAEFGDVLGTGGMNRVGGTLTQSLLGFRFNGPELPGNGRINGNLDLMFWGGGEGSNWLQIRRGTISFDWKDRSFEVGEDKPLISQRAPESLAEVALPALSDEGNPWLWLPQARYTERVALGEQTGVDLQASILGTQETAAYVPGNETYSIEHSRPAFEARVNLRHRHGENTRFEIAPGLHVSTSHVNGFSVPSRFGSVDWLIQPAHWVTITGLVFGGRNLANLGGFSDGFSLYDGQEPHAIRGIGGWNQVSFPLTARLTWNLFGGLQAARTSDLTTGAVTHATAYATNLIYRLGPNVLLGAEVLQERTGYLDQTHLLRNHYDLSIGYLF